MNFSPFLPFTSTALPVNTASVPQLTTNTKFANVSTTQAGGQVVAVLNSDESGVTYLRPIDTNELAVNLGGSLNNQQHNQIITLPITIQGTKPGEQPQQQTIQIQVVNSNSSNNSDKVLPLSLQPFGPVFHLAYNHQTQDEIQLQLQQPTDVDHEMAGDQTNNSDNDNSTQSMDAHTVNNDSPVGLQDVKPNMSELTQNQDQHAASGSYPLTVVVPPEIILRTTLGDHLDNGNKNDEINKEKDRVSMNSWQATPVSPAVAEYLSHLPADSLQLANLQHFLKFSNDTIKREHINMENNADDGTEGHVLEMDPGDLDSDQLKGKKKKKYKKKPPKPRRPRPGQVHIATALDGTLLFCCPECNMAYPDKEMLEQHLVAHKIDRRYICDICGAGLKRKEHLERHKLGHNPERPYVCEICTKGFKRKEHLNLHAVIHSGEKTEICTECGKGFYRRDHLRKHTKSHIAKRMREELHQQQQQLHQMQEQQQHQQQLQHRTILTAASTQENGVLVASPPQENRENALIIKTNSNNEPRLVSTTVPSDPLKSAVIMSSNEENGATSLLIQQQHQSNDEQLDSDHKSQET